jgi:hypothetical protein
VRADPGSGDLALGQDPEQDHQFVVRCELWIDLPTELGQPYGHAVVFEHRCHCGELLAGEGAFAGSDDDGVEPAVRIGEGREQRGGLGTPGPRKRAAVADVEELRHDPPKTVRHGVGAQPLPRP